MLTFFDTLLLIAILIIVFSVYWFWTIPRNLPPGPVGVPIVGNYLSMVDGHKQDAVLRRWAKQYGPLFRIYVGNKLVVVLSDYETIHDALTKHGDTYNGRVEFKAVTPERFVGKGIIASHGQLWKEQRRFALSVLRDLGLGRPILEPHIRQEVENLIDTMLEHGDRSFDPLKYLVRASTTVIYGLIFGRFHNFERRETIVKAFLLAIDVLVKSNTAFLSPLLLSETISKLLKYIPQVQQFQKQNHDNLKILEAEMNDVKGAYDPSLPPDNYIHAFMRASESGEGEYFDDDQLMATAYDLFSAGTQTTAITVYSAILCLGHHPQVQERMHEEICEQLGASTLPSYADRTKLPYTEAVLQEVDRFANLAPMGVFRKTIEPSKLLGYDIPEGAIVCPLLSNVFKDETYFENAEMFEPERFIDGDGKFKKDPRVVPFQMGKRACLGESMARMELFQFITGLVSRLRITFPSDKPKPSLKLTGGFLSLPELFEICVEARRA